MVDRADEPGRGQLLRNLMYFARVLRIAGVPVGPGRLLAAVEALRVVGLENRQDFYWTLHAVFVSRREQRVLFDQAFHIFWRNPRLLERAIDLVIPPTRLPAEEQAAMLRRLAEAAAKPRPAAAAVEDLREVNASETASERELLRKTDFEQMSSRELQAAKVAIGRLRLPMDEVRTRRFMPARATSTIDMRATLRASLRGGAATIWLKGKRPRRRPPPLVILSDISGSMSRYSRIFLHFMHAVTNDRDRVHTFLFGTRLTNITRHLRHRDVDIAVDRVVDAVADWSGGTRIGDTISIFNRIWSRRVLAQGAMVLLITDGLDSEGGAILGQAMERLHKSCRRLIWLNPLLRWDGFRPKSQGARAILPHVDELRAVHNLDSLVDLAAALSRPSGRRLEAATIWRDRAA